MAKSKPSPAADPAPAASAEYTVVARRYRPTQLAELIGQEHVARSLTNALQSGRVAHAYLFTGARGVGKTSAARILAKCLNCEKGPTATPCDTCDSCIGIAAGEDVDVLEIDGASNNKVEEVRDLRQNVGFRPTRGRYKIYIIDEVHMLSTSAFNALLKTLEEPPAHVKFIFATTEVQKIPITILSRCQRFDFAHVGPGKIFDQLKSIVAREGHQADDDALKLVARRAAGSMRDSQSLLDQLLAAGEGKLTSQQVHAVLGTAGDERVTELAATVLKRDAKTSLNLLAGWVESGLQVGELVDQLIEYWRSLMLVSCGGPEVGELPVTPSQREAILQQVRGLSLDTILTGLEVWTTAKGRMRGSNHTQVLLEMALVRLCRLDEMLSVAQLIQGVGQGTIAPPAPAANNGSPRPATVRPPEATDGSKKNDLTPAESPQNAGTESTVVLSESTLADVWARLKSYLLDKSPILANHLKNASLPAIFGPNSLAIPFDPRYNHAHAACATESNTLRVQDALRRITGQPAVVKFEIRAGLPPAHAHRPAREHRADAQAGPDAVADFQEGRGRAGGADLRRGRGLQPGRRPAPEGDPADRRRRHRFARPRAGPRGAVTMFKEMGDMMKLLGNRGKIQEEVQKFQANVGNITAEATAGAGYVTTKVNGRFEVLSVRISEEAMALNDREMLEDLIAAATNQAMAKVRTAVAEESAKMAQNMGLPPGMLGGGLPGLS